MRYIIISTIASLVFILSTASHAAATLSPHKCPEGNALPLRSIREAKDITPPKCIHQVKPLVPKGTTQLGMNMCMHSYELLIDEQGKVECVEHIKGDISNKELLANLEEALLQWLFEPPKDKDGKRTACYYLVTVNLDIFL